MTYSIELKNLSKSVKDHFYSRPKWILQGVNASFPTGACTGLIGHNGAGKSTVFKIILGLTQHDRGEVWLGGGPLQRNSSRANIGYMSEVSLLPPTLTCEEALKFQWLRYAGNTPGRRTAEKQVITQALGSAELLPHRHKRIGALSKGLARRLLWTLITIHQPDILILDEPMSGLDPLGRSLMESWILAEKRQGRTIILSSHDLTSLERVCDEIYILNRGQMVFSSREHFSKNGEHRWDEAFILKMFRTEDPL